MADLLRHLQLPKQELLRLLEQMEQDQASSAQTFFFKAGSSPSRDSLLDADDSLRDLLIPRIAGSETGSAVIWVGETVHLVLPPFPLKEEGHYNRLELSPLRRLLTQEYTIGVVLLRLGRYAIGLFRGERLMSYKTGTRYVKGRHRAGGSSQRRFERIREKQIRELYDHACQVAREKLTPTEDGLDFILLGGERFTVGGFLTRCEYLQRLSGKTLKRLLMVDRPGLKALEALPRQIWMSTVYIFDQGGVT